MLSFPLVHMVTAWPATIIKNLIPAVVMVSKGEDRLIVKPQTYEDLLRNEII